MNTKRILIWLLCLLIPVGAGACHRAGRAEAEPQAPGKSISILAIGNSFSVDAMQDLYDILKEGGTGEIVLGNLYIGGCTLKRHAGNFTQDSPDYTYYKNTSGKWTSTTSFKPLDALMERDWDIITLQQASGVSGMPESFDPYLDTLLSIVRAKCPRAKLYWHMTWAYQGNSTHKEFPGYGSDQMTMYNAIVATVGSKVLSRSEFSGVIPSGTTIQNLRTSFYGDTVTRDGYHLSYNVGRYAAALTWAAVLGHIDPERVAWAPTKFTYTDKELKAIRDAAAKAVKEPFKVTASGFPSE